MAKNQTMYEQAKKSPLQGLMAGLAVAGVFISLLNFYLLSRISPILFRVEAVEREIEARTPLVQRFLVTEQKVEDTNARLIRIEDKIDRIILEHK